MAARPTRRKAEVYLTEMVPTYRPAELAVGLVTSFQHGGHSYGQLLYTVCVFESY